MVILFLFLVHVCSADLPTLLAILIVINLERKGKQKMEFAAVMLLEPCFLLGSVGGSVVLLLAISSFSDYRYLGLYLSANRGLCLHLIIVVPM